MSGKTQAPRGKGGAGKAVKPGRGREPRGLAKLFSRLEDPSLRGAQINYYVVLGSTLALTLLGLIMVLSSSSVEAIARNKSPFDDFSKQAMWAVFGLLCMGALQLLPTDKLKVLAWPALGIATVLLMMVLVFGEEIYGNKNWLIIGGFSVQPSEFAKAAMALWGAAVVERKAHLMGQWKHAVVPLLAPFGGLMLLLVMIGKDLGTAMVLALILVVVMFVGGAPAKIFGIGAGVAAVGLAIAVAVAPTRLGRVTAWLFGCAADAQDYCYQAEQGIYALASGGWLGVGLGQSRQKWSHIPEAQNDFIFAVLGEEMGLLGTLFVVLLYTMLAVAMFRIAVRSETLFGRVAVSGIMAWIVGQAFVNIGMVIGLLPVIGVPLPFISSGGSALLATFLGIGVVLSFAREQRMGKQGRATPGTLPGLMAKLRGTKAN
ncbi:putative lipid II flippase FtsW [Paeniglutamicibacter kerguelensis]|uniref:Probable peptidoglycan glycosyltransferase FtsW n=1 Tax=Paeniglutamicibacter kerguelensis TaxID=254788 RepID=A0ABS4XEC6_9MICC|nr:cell division protein FtsW [Paeniglutamicibacter kerguelensis]